ncbi:MAG: heparinase II/III family protein [Clostridia bacterium]|nr:heparinase II/III family protein [Clostridia bacterium]
MNLLTKATDKEFWKGVREKDCYKKYRDELFDMWEKNVENGPILSLKYSEYKLFFTTGNRNIYEAAYFTRRRALDCAALLSLIYPEEEKYLERLMDQIFAICDEYSWCLPAHQGELEPNNTTRLDLFASETGFALAEIYTMLSDRLDPLIKNRIVAEIDRRVINEIINHENYNWWENGQSNWTAVCMGSIGCTFMLMRPELFERFKPRLDSSMECYLSGFEDDGICLEGCHYWHYGFGFFTVYADMVRRFTGGETDYFKLPKVKKIATFIQKTFLSGNSSVSFADAGPLGSYHLGLCHYLKNEYPDDVVVFDPKYSYNYDDCGRFCLQLRSAIWLDEEYYYNPAPDNVAAEYYAPDSEWFIKRTECYGFAAKGGSNGEPHNHNDVGTFIFAKNGEQMIMDLGGGTYSRQYFSDERYSFLEADSRGHNLPIVNNCVQYQGNTAKAKDARVENGEFKLDISPAYNVEGLEAINRSFSFTDTTVTLTDEFVYSGKVDIVDRLVSFHEIELVKDGVIRIKDATVTYDPNKYELTVEKEACRFKKDVFANYASFKLKDGVSVFKITIE